MRNSGLKFEQGPKLKNFGLKAIRGKAIGTPRPQL